MNPPRAFSAYAFDFDGTLVDTMGLHFEAYRRVFEEAGLELTREDFFDNIGGKASETIPLFLRGRPCALTVPELHARKKKQVADLFREADLTVLPSARLLPVLSQLAPLALVSSGSRPGIEQLLDRLGWRSYFKVIVTGEDTERSKPDPMPYLLAADLLGVLPAEMLAFEDTVAGWDSARAAGMTVFLVEGNSPVSVS
ncbi:MAG: HAD family phosphatase [Luteolibacter sp.]